MNVSSSEAPALLNTTLQRLAAQSAACKLWSIVLTSVVLIMAAGRMGAEVLVWAAAPALLLGLADAAYKVQAGRIAALATQETVNMKDMFRIQTGNAGFAASLQSLRGLTSFSVWPFYVTLATMVILLGQTVLLPSGKPPTMPQNPSINATPFQPNTPRPAYTIQQSPSALPPGAVYSGNPNMPPTSFAPPNGSQQYQPPPNQITVSRPNIPPMGVPTAKPNAPGATTKAPAGANRPPPPPANLNRPATNTFPPQSPKQPAPTPAKTSLLPKSGSTDAQQPK